MSTPGKIIQHPRPHDVSALVSSIAAVAIAWLITRIPMARIRRRA